MLRLALLACVLIAVPGAVPIRAAEVRVAVAANFFRPAEELGAAFAARTGDTVTISPGATGALYAQISQGAPFEVFLAADSRRPDQAVRDHLGVDGTVFTYAVGKIVLYSPSIDVSDGEAVLRDGAFGHVAIADPATAPYGAAALEIFAKLGLAGAMAPRQVTGESITQTLQFVDSGNAEIGFVALSQVIGKPSTQVWHVPDDYYSPIRQDAVLLRAGEGNPAARAFLEFLTSREGKAIIARYGYETQ